MFRKNKDKLLTMKCGDRWIRLVNKLSHAEARVLLPKVIKDTDKTYHLLRHFNGWSARDVRTVFEAGYEHYHIHMMLPLATGEILAPDTVDAMLAQEEDFMNLVGTFAAHIRPTLEQVVAMLGHGNIALLAGWLEHNPLEALWEHVIRNDHVNVARTLNKVRPLQVRNIDISNAGNNGQWEMVGLFLEITPETDELVLIMLVHFLKPKLLQVAWRKAPTACKLNTINWLWYDTRHNHRSALLQVPLDGVPIQPDMVLESVGMEDRRFVDYFLRQGWAVLRKDKNREKGRKKR